MNAGLSPSVLGLLMPMLRLPSAPVGTFATNNDDVMLGAALQGVGLVMHLDFAVRQHLASGTLVSVMEDWCLPFEGFNIYVPSRDQMPAKLRAFVDFLVEKRRQLERLDLITRLSRLATRRRLARRPAYIGCRLVAERLENMNLRSRPT